MLLCSHLSAATISHLDKKAPPLPQPTAPDREQGEVKFDWAPLEINGKKYVPLSKMRQFYSLDHEKVHNKDITMSNTKIKAQFTLDSQLVALNGIRIYLSEPIKTQEKKAYISKLDINSLIDPVFRPKHILNAPPRPNRHPRCGPRRLRQRIGRSRIQAYPRHHQTSRQAT